MSDFRSPADIDAAKANLEQARKENSEQSIISGYFAGGEIVIDANLDVIFGPFMADVLGQKVSRSRDTNLSDFTWRVARINKQYYHLYLNKGNLLFVDLQEPDLMKTQYGLYHPVTRERYVGTVYVDENGLYTQVISHKRVRIEDLDVQTLSTSEAFIDLLSASMINADIVIIGFTGEDINNPAEGDRRVYIDGDEISFEEFTAGAYTTVNSIKLGGVDSNNNFAPFLACRGISNPLADDISLEFLPDDAFRVFDFDNDYEDQHGVDDWTVKDHLGFNASIKKFGTHALECVAGQTEGLASFGGAAWLYDSSQSAGVWIYLDNWDAKKRVIHFSSTQESIYLWVNADRTVSAELQEENSSGGPNLTVTTVGVLTADAWNFIAFSWHVGDGILSVIGNSEIVSDTTGTAIPIFGAATTSLYPQRISTISNPVDELTLNTNIYTDPDIWVQHYNHNIAWNTDASAKDIILNPASGGVVRALEPGVFEKGLKVPFLHVQDQKTSGTVGGTFTSGAWRKRTLDDVVTNTIKGASESSSQITLPAGTYYIEGIASAFSVNRHVVRLQNITDTVTEMSGMPTYAAAADNVANNSCFGKQLTITGTKVFELQHQCQTTRGTNGLGVSAGISFTVDREVYADLKIWQLAG